MAVRYGRRPIGRRRRRQGGPRGSLRDQRLGEEELVESCRPLGTSVPSEREDARVYGRSVDEVRDFEGHSLGDRESDRESDRRATQPDRLTCSATKRVSLKTGPSPMRSANRERARLIDRFVKRSRQSDADASSTGSPVTFTFEFGPRIGPNFGPQKLAHKKSRKSNICNDLQFGTTGFEPATSWSQTRRSSQAELRPVVCLRRALKRRRCFEGVSKVFRGSRGGCVSESTCGAVGGLCTPNDANLRSGGGWTPILSESAGDRCPVLGGTAAG